MNVLMRAVCAAILVATTVIMTGCGESFRQVATPQPVSAGNPAGSEFEVVLNQCPSLAVCTDVSGSQTGSDITAIDVAGDVNMGNKSLQNTVGSVAGPVPGSIGVPIAFDATRTSLFTANTSTDSVTRVSLAASAAGFSANTSTLSLPPGAAPVAISFQLFGLPYKQDYVLNSGVTPVCPAGGSLGVIDLATTTLSTSVCLGAGADPVAAWIFKDLTKVFVLDFSQSSVHVVDVNPLDLGTPKLTHTIPLLGGIGPFKVAQNNDGLFLYVLNSNHSISIINTQTETVVGTVPTDNPGSTAAPVDMARPDDAFAITQANHVWILHADGVVSVFDGTAVSAVPPILSWITSYDTGGTPTNLALLRDGTWAYVGLAGTNQVVGIDTSKVSKGFPTVGATTLIPIPGRLVPGNLAGETLETTKRTVTSVAVSRQGDSAQLSKLYVTTVTNTTFNYYDQAGNLLNSANYPDLFNGTAIVSAAFLPGGAPALNTPINTLITILPAPTQVAECNPGNAAPGYDVQKNCPAMQPVLALGGN